MSELGMLRDADEKYRRGDALTDEELKALARAYRSAQVALAKIFHRSYDLTERDLYHRATQLEGFIKSRRENPKRKWVDD